MTTEVLTFKSRSPSASVSADIALGPPITLNARADRARTSPSSLVCPRTSTSRSVERGSQIAQTELMAIWRTACTSCVDFSNARVAFLLAILPSELAAAIRTSWSSSSSRSIRAGTLGSPMRTRTSQAPARRSDAFTAGCTSGITFGPMPTRAAFAPLRTFSSESLMAATSSFIWSPPRAIKASVTRARAFSSVSLRRIRHCFTESSPGTACTASTALILAARGISCVLS